MATIDRGLGKVTFTANVSTLSDVAAGDFVFNSGDRQDSAAAVPIVPIGLAGFLPLTAPTSGDSVFGSGVDRSVDSDYLAGVRLDCRGLGVTESIDETLARLDETDGTPKAVMISSGNWKKYKLEQNNKVEREPEPGEAPPVSRTARRIVRDLPPGP